MGGTVRRHIGTFEVDAKISTHPQSEHEVLEEKAKRYGGLGVYRDSLRAQPYGCLAADSSVWRSAVPDMPAVSSGRTGEPLAVSPSLGATIRICGTRLVERASSTTGPGASCGCWSYRFCARLLDDTSVPTPRSERRSFRRSRPVTSGQENQSRRSPERPGWNCERLCRKGSLDWLWA